MNWKKSAAILAAAPLASCANEAEINMATTKTQVIQADASAKKRPNLLFVYADQMRGSAMGFLGEEPVKTPNLDMFAKQSLVLPQAASNYPVCVPYRTILMTGKYSVSNGVMVNCFSDGVDLPDHHVWWTDVLNQNNYDVGYLGKWHITKNIKEYNGKKLSGAAGTWLPPIKRHGISYWQIHTSNNHLKNAYVINDTEAGDMKKVDQWTPEYETDRAIEYIKNEDGSLRDSNKPFALVISWNPPHSPYGPVPEKYKKMYEGSKELAEFADSQPHIGTTEDKRGRANRRQTPLYYAAVTGIDEQFGRLMETLKEQGLDDNTIVVFTADHGDTMGRHGAWDPKNHIWESAMRIPFLIRWPKKIPARHDDLLLSTADMYPTLMTLMGIDNLPSGLEGTDFAKLFSGENQQRPTSQLYMYIKDGIGDPLIGRRGVRTHRYTMAMERIPGSPLKAWLFDRVEDPFETNNIAADNPEILKKLLEEELVPWIKHTKDPFVLLTVEEMVEAAKNMQTAF